MRIGEAVGNLREQPTDLKIQVYRLADADARSVVRILSKLLPEVETRKVRIAVNTQSEPRSLPLMGLSAG